MFRLLLLVGFISPAVAFAAADPKKADPKAKKGEAEVVPPAPYDRICHVEVSYIWKAKPALSSEPGASVISKEYFASVSEQGFVPEEIQDRLKTKLTSVRAQAMRNCNEEHQDVNGCVAKKLTGLASEFPRLDFGRRKMIVESVREDCGSNVGQCVATEVSEMKCWMNVPPETVVPNEPKVEIAAPGNTEPPVSGLTDEDEGEDLDAEDLDAAEETEADLSGVSETEKAEKPAKKAKKKRKKVDEDSKKADGKGKGSSAPEPENPYSQPFSIP